MRALQSKTCTAIKMRALQATCMYYNAPMSGIQKRAENDNDNNDERDGEGEGQSNCHGGDSGDGDDGGNGSPSSPVVVMCCRVQASSKIEGGKCSPVPEVRRKSRGLPSGTGYAPKDGP